MRSDLTAAFIAAKDSASRKPRQLLVFQFPVAGNVYISDQEITLGGNTYLPLVEDWGTLADSAGAESDFTAETRQMSVTLWNGGSRPFSTYFLQEDPEDVEVLLYQWFDGLADSDKLLLERLVVQDPIKFAEASRLLTLDLVSINMRYVARVGATVTTALWPKALTEHVGQPIPLIFGDAGECNTLCVKTAPAATLKGSIAKGSLIIDCNESLALFPASGSLQIDDERIQYSSRTDLRFNVSLRGAGGTVKESHADGTEVHQLITDHTYLVGELPLASITDVKVDGYPAPAGIYSVSLAGSYGKILFSEKPYAFRYSASVQIQELASYLTAADNTAWQPHYAYDKNKTSSSALINEVYPTLSIACSAINSPDRGLITTAYLVVHHWETDLMPNDYVEVWVDGVGVVGRLAKPAADDVFHLDAEVDIDHSHDHRTGDSHTHPHSDGSYNANASGHVHPVDGDGVAIVGIPGVSLPYVLQPPAGGSTSKTISYTYSGVPGGAVYKNSSIQLEVYCASVKVVAYWGGLELGSWDFRSSGSGYGTVSRSNINDSSGAGLYFIVYGSNVVGAYASIRVAQITRLYGSTMQNAASQVTPYLAAAGSNQTIYNTNRPDDVIPLLTDNQQIQIISQQSPSRTLIDRFDLSDYLDPTWQWFAGRKIQVRYKGTANNVNVFIPWIYFEIEYRPRERVYSDNVTATVSGNPSRRPDQVLQALLGKGGLPGGYVDSTSFAAAGAWYATNSYTIDGVIDGGLTVAEAIKQVCWQTRSRLYWSAGLAMLAVRKKPLDWSIGKYLGPANYQLRSIVATRQPISDLVNRIELYYTLDRTDDEQPYRASVIQEDAASIAAHGTRERREAFRCDLVRSAAMASSLTDYYLTTLAYPSTIYEFNAYLEQSELEKEDIIALTSAWFHKIRKMPLRVKEVSRQFGSGKNRTINHLRIIAECLRYVLLELSAADSVLVMDSLTATIGRLIDLADSLHIQDELTSHEECGQAEEAIITEALEILWTINEALTETISIDDELSCGLAVAIEEQITILDSLTVWRDLGFGSGDFGTCGFGGVKTWTEGDADEAFVFEQIGSHMGVAPVFDWEYRQYGLYPWQMAWVVTSDAATATISDALIASNGFGSGGSLSDGFSNIPFGR